MTTSKKRKKQKQQAKIQRRQQEMSRKPVSQPQPQPPAPAELPEEKTQASAVPDPRKILGFLSPKTPEDREALAAAFQEAFGSLGPEIPKDPEAAIAAFQEALASGQIDSEEAFERLEGIRSALGHDTPAARARYAALIEQLHQQAPDLYRKDAAYYHENLINDAVTDGRWEALPELLAPFVREPDRHVDLFFQVIDQLLYHGQTQTLLDVMRQAWPVISQSGKVTPWGIEEFGGEAMLLELVAYLDTAEAPRADDSALLEATAPYGEWAKGWLERAIPRLTSSVPSPWQPADFGEAVDADQWQENLHALLLEFVADRRSAGVPLSRGFMAQRQLNEFLNWQFSGPALSDRGQARGKRSGGKGREQTQPRSESPLVPRYKPLDRFLAKLFPFLGGQPYKAIAVMEVLPAYLHFLARLSLIHPTEMDGALEELRPLSQQLLPALRSFGADLVAIQAVTTAWGEETLTALRDDPALAAARATPPPAPAAPPPILAPRPGALATYTFKVTYLEKPEVWRTIEITGDQTLDDLHYAILRAVNFDADHLYSFFMSGEAWDDTTEYASPHGEGRSAARVKIRDLGLRMKQRFLYLYDYGDEHRFDVQLVAFNPDAPRGDYPRIIERHGRAPRQYREW